MCLIVFKPAGIVIPEEHLKNGYHGNDDGWGIAYCNNEGMVKIRKNVSNYAQFLEMYNGVVTTFPESPVIVHFRLATHGARDSSMCHPFYAANGAAAVAHNGILSAYSTPDRNEKGNLSDTARFIERRLSPHIIRSWGEPMYTKEWGENLGKEIGSHNKLAILTQGNGFVIINADEGEWFNGAWYSNGGYAYTHFRSWNRRQRKKHSGVQQSLRWDKESQEFITGGWNTDPTYDYWHKVRDDVNEACGKDCVDDGERILAEKRSKLREVIPSLVECDICNGHIKGRFYVGPTNKGDDVDTVEFICEQCAEEFLGVPIQ